MTRAYTPRYAERTYAPGPAVRAPDHFLATTLRGFGQADSTGVDWAAAMEATSPDIPTPEVYPYPAGPQPLASASFWDPTLGTVVLPGNYSATDTAYVQQAYQSGALSDRGLQQIQTGKVSSAALPAFLATDPGQPEPGRVSIPQPSIPRPTVPGLAPGPAPRVSATPTGAGITGQTWAGIPVSWWLIGGALIALSVLPGRGRR